MNTQSAGARFRAALNEETPLQVMGAITAYAGLMAKRTGYRALYLSGGGVAANSLGMPDLGISTMEDVLTDARRIVDATGMPLLVDIDTGWGGAFNIGRTIRNFERIGVAAVHMEDQVGQKRCGHRPGKEVVSKDEMVDRVKAAVDARTDPGFVIMARTDAAAVEGLDSAIERAVAYVEAGADMIFPEAMKTLDDYRTFKAAVKAQPVRYEEGVLHFATVTFHGPSRASEVDGKAVNLAPSRGYDSPFIRSDWNSGLIYIRHGEDTEVLDFRDPKKPSKLVGAPVTDAFPPGAGTARPVIFGKGDR